jgi:hypothetical protein
VSAEAGRDRSRGDRQFGFGRVGLSGPRPSVQRHDVVVPGSDRGRAVGGCTDSLSQRDIFDREHHKNVNHPEVDTNARFSPLRHLDLGVTGHASEDGTPEYNSWLSGRRAKAAFEDLKSRGVPEQQLRYRAVGESACRPYPIHRSVYFEIEEYR